MASLLAKIVNATGKNQTRDKKVKPTAQRGMFQLVEAGFSKVHYWLIDRHAID